MLAHSAPQAFPLRPDAQSGPATRVVAIGGGTGLPNVLRGLRPLLFPEGARDLGTFVTISPVAVNDNIIDRVKWPSVERGNDEVTGIGR